MPAMIYERDEQVWLLPNILDEIVCLDRADRPPK